MIILSKDTCTRVDTKDVLLIDYDFIGKRLYAVVANGQVSMKVTLIEGIDKDAAWAIISSIAMQESIGDKIFRIKSYRED